MGDLRFETQDARHKIQPTDISRFQMGDDSSVSVICLYNFLVLVGSYNLILPQRAQSFTEFFFSVYLCALCGDFLHDNSFNPRFHLKNIEIEQ